MVVLVTGSSKGIGYQIANDLLDQGHDLILHYNMVLLKINPP